MNEINRVREAIRMEFHEFLSEQEYEIDPKSHLYELMEITFRNGFCLGGQLGTKMLAEHICNLADGDSDASHT